MATRPALPLTRLERCVVVAGAALFPACGAGAAATPGALDPSPAAAANDGCFMASPGDRCADIGDDALGFGRGALADPAAHPTDRSLAQRAYTRGCYADGASSWVACSRILALGLAGNDRTLESRAIETLASLFHEEAPQSLATDALRRTIALNRVIAAGIPVDTAGPSRRAREIAAKDAAESTQRPWAFQVPTAIPAYEDESIHAASSMPGATHTTGGAPHPASNVARELDALTVASAASMPRLSRWLGIAFPSVPMPAGTIDDPACDQTCALTKYLCASGALTECERLATAYAVGAGVPKDPARALAIDQAICDTDAHFGCRELGWSYVAGRGVPKNSLRGITLMRRACDAKQRPACDFIVSWDQQHPSAPPALPADVVDDPACTANASCKTFRDACSGGARTCIALGNLYRTGADGSPKDLARAAKVLQATCTVDPAACAELAVMYWNGEGFPVDRERAMAVAKQACESQAGAPFGASGAEACYRVGTWGDKAYAVAHLSAACAADEAQSCGFLAAEPATRARGLARLRSLCDAKNAVACETLAGLEQGGRPPGGS